MKSAPEVHDSKSECNQALSMPQTRSAAINSHAEIMNAIEPYLAILRSFSGYKRWMLFMSVRVRPTLSERQSSVGFIAILLCARERLDSRHLFWNTPRP